MGPKKFETWIHCLGIIVKQVFRLSYRRTIRFLDEYYKIKVHYTTLQKAARRLPKSIWQSLLAATLDYEDVYLAVDDGTGYSRTNPSSYYLKRIDRLDPVKRPLQVMTIVDVQKRKFLAGNLYAKPRNEARSIPQLHKKISKKPEVLLLDKAYDAEWLHQWLEENGTFSVAPARKGCRRGRHRKIMRDCIDYTLYWQRNIIESLYSALKRLFGNSLSGKHIKTQTAELFSRLIAYNIGLRLWRFSTEPFFTGSNYNICYLD
ncbi:MAG: transposase [Candidatus Woesearchaeota archaeon]